MSGSDVRADVVFRQSYGYLNACAVADPKATAWAAYAWMSDQSAGMPVVPLMGDSTRSEALFWAESATPVELECYLLAAIKRLGDMDSLFHGGQIKRLIASLWAKLSPDERVAFTKWAMARAENDG